MDTVIELQGIGSADWFNELSKALSTTKGLGDVHIEELRPAPGTFGALWSPKAQARFSRASELASVLGLAIGLYGVFFATPPQFCQVRIMTASERVVELVVPCTPQQRSELIESLTDAFERDAAQPVRVELIPRNVR